MILIEYAPDRFHDLQSTIEHLQHCLLRKGAQVMLLSEVTDDSPDPDMVIVVGGDGTIMRSLQKHTVPVFGINGGTVGFLAGAEDRYSDIEVAVQRLLDDDYIIEDRLALHALVVRRDPQEVVTGIQPIVNEVAIQHDQYPFRLKVSLNGLPMWDSLFARGVMIATATGSPAWNFSSGGPLLFPESEDVAVTPINPQYATVRPLTLPHLARGGSIEVEVQPSKDMDIQFIIDGRRLQPLRFGDKVKITRSPATYKLITFGDTQFFSALRKKGIAIGVRKQL